ncbi:uncharacterized protein BDV14DRAFT_202295 [Aspergillus stella-maris]|uniref:uncharacterized protein n=1 Tax=Aspergillus stella-maris TaxID=1810926 RepID=UPI003CCD1C7A
MDYLNRPFPIHLIYRECHEAFNDLLATLSLETKDLFDAPHGTSLRDAIARFTFRSYQLGIRESGSSSLDTRLRDSKIRFTLLRCLEELCGTVEGCIDVVVDCCEGGKSAPSGGGGEERDLDGVIGALREIHRRLLGVYEVFDDVEDKFGDDKERILISTVLVQGIQRYREEKGMKC